MFLYGLAGAPLKPSIFYVLQHKGASLTELTAMYNNDLIKTPLYTLWKIAISINAFIKKPLHTIWKMLHLRMLRPDTGSKKGLQNTPGSFRPECLYGNILHLVTTDCSIVLLEFDSVGLNIL